MPPAQDDDDDDTAVTGGPAIGRVRVAPGGSLTVSSGRTLSIGGEDHAA